MYLKKSLWILAVLIFFTTLRLTAQNASVSGNLVDAASRRPVPYASVTLRQLQDSTVFTGSLADSTGKFLITDLAPGTYRMAVSFIGYLTKTDTILLDAGAKLRLADIMISPDSKALGEVLIEEERPDFQLGIDKKIFLTEKSLIAAGGSALDVLRQVPTVNVDVDGKISMRGSENLVIFINGKPSGLTAQNRDQILQQIPGSNVEKIELITNPSAKYDADGMSGIINIVTKKSVGEGMLGSLTLGIGTFHKYNASGSLTYRNDRWTVSNTLGFRYNQNFTENFGLRANYPEGMPVYSNNQYGNGRRRSVSPTLTGNIDYTFNKSNSLGFNYLLSYSDDASPELLRYYFLDENDWLYRRYNRDVNSSSGNVSLDFGLTQVHKGKKTDRELTTSINYSYSASDQDDHFRQQEYTLYEFPDSTISPLLQNNYINDVSMVGIFQMDYVHPFGKGYKIETGGKINIRNFDNTFVADSFSYAENRLVTDTALTNHFIYFENVNAAYGTFSGKAGNFSYQAGLRIEQTNITGVQEVGSLNFSKNYINFFPSAFLNYKFKNDHEIQLAYSRRINRPGLRSLNPFAEYDDPLNLFRGNPDLNPENIDAVEFTYSRQWKAHTLLSTVYFRHVDGVITRFREVDSNGVATVTPINLERALNFGLELVARNRWFKWWNTTANVNIFRNQVLGGTDGELNATNFSYNLRLQSNFKMGNIAEFQVSFNYMGPNVFPQGRMSEMWGIDAALRFDFLKGRAAITLNVTDIFDTRRFAVISQDVNFYSDNYRKRETRIGTVQFTYKFGNSSQNTQPQRRRGGQNNEGGQEMEMF